jgi:hypothetical protein
MGKWKPWQMDCKVALEKFKLNSQLSRVLRILCGDEETILQICSTQWQEALVALLVHVHPVTQAHQLQ